MRTSGRIPFRVAIVTVVVGLLLVTCGFLITFALYRGQRNIELLKRDYLEQVADTAVREVARLPQTAAQVLRVEQHRCESAWGRRFPSGRCWPSGATGCSCCRPPCATSPLDPPIEASVRLVLGKQIDRQTHAARLHRLGAGGAEIESGAPLAVFGALQVLLPSATGGDGSRTDGALTVDGKVIGMAEQGSEKTALVRFTGIDWDTQARIETQTRRSLDSTRGR